MTAPAGPPVSMLEATSAELFADVVTELTQQGTCSTCGRPGERVARHDAVACLGCNVWLEGLCGEDGCAYCIDRPATPVRPS